MTTRTGLGRSAVAAARWLALLGVLLLGGCASDARLPAEPHQLGIHAAHTASADGLLAMTDRHSGVRLWVAPQALLTEADVAAAEMAMTPEGEPAVIITLTDRGRAILADLTRKTLGQPLAIVLGGELRLAPIVREPVLDGRVALTGFDSLEEAEALVHDWDRR